MYNRATMKKQRAAQVTVGVLVLLFPFLGDPLPYAWQASILYILGAAVIALAFPIGACCRAFFKRSCCSGGGCAVCDPAAPEAGDEHDGAGQTA